MATKRIGSLRATLQACGLAWAGTAGLASAQVYLPGPTAAMPTSPVVYQDGSALAAVPMDGGTVLQGPAVHGTLVQGSSMPSGGETGLPFGADGCTSCGLFGNGSEARLGGACGADGCHRECSIDQWVVHVDALAMFRSRGRSLGLGGIQRVVPNGPIELRSLNDSFGVAPGYRVTVARTLPKVSNCDVGIEFGFFQALGFNKREDGLFAPPGRLTGGVLDVLNNENGQTVAAGVGAFQRQTIQAYNASSLHGGEVNGKLDYFLDGSTVLLGGLRFFRFYDKLDLRETGVVGAANVNAVREARVLNNMLGLQLGTESNRALSERLTLTYGFKAGLLGNVIDGAITQTSNVTASGNPYARGFDLSRTKATGMVEFGLGANYMVKERLNLRAGYQLLYLSNVGTGLRAPIPSFAGGDIGRLGTGGLLYHGAFAGLEWHWGCCN